MKLLICLMLLSSSAFAGHTGEFDGVTYYNDGELNVHWNTSVGATYWEVKTIWRHPSQNPAYDIEYMYGPFSVTNVSLPQRRAGFFRVAVRACNASQCSIWSESINPIYAINNKPWQVFWLLPKPVVVIE